MKVLARFPSPTGERPASGRPVLTATAVAAGCLVAVGLAGTLSMRHFGAVPFSVPSWPWYHSWPSYLFWQPTLDAGAALAALPLALAAAAVLVALARAGRLARGPRLAGSMAAVFTLALAVAALAGGPAAWSAPLAFVGEYPGAVGQVGAIPTFLGEFAARVPSLPDFAAQHPPFATLFYVLVARVWRGGSLWLLGLAFYLASPMASLVVQELVPLMVIPRLVVAGRQADLRRAGVERADDARVPVS